MAAKRSIRQVYAANGSCARPARRAARRRWRRPQTKGWRWAFQYCVAAVTAAQTSSQLAKRRPLSAKERSTFHQGSIRLRSAAQIGWKTNLMSENDLHSWGFYRGV
jgi:hypothetical protein